MRKIDTFVITRTTGNYPAIVQESFDHGMKYPYPHIYIFKGDESEDDYSLLRLRPICERCGNIRDSRLNNSGIGIVIMTDSPIMNEKIETIVANSIRLMIDDLCIENYEIVTDEINEDKFVDVFGIDAKVATLPSMFTKNPSV